MTKTWGLLLLFSLCAHVLPIRGYLPTFLLEEVLSLLDYLKIFGIQNADTRLDDFLKLYNDKKNKSPESISKSAELLMAQIWPNDVADYDKNAEKASPSTIKERFLKQGELLFLKSLISYSSFNSIYGLGPIDNVLDLHGLNTKLAVAVVKTILKLLTCHYKKIPDLNVNPYVCFITGRGIHSKGRVPAIKNALIARFENKIFEHPENDGVLCMALEVLSTVSSITNISYKVYKLLKKKKPNEENSQDDDTIVPTDNPYALLDPVVLNRIESSVDSNVQGHENYLDVDLPGDDPSNETTDAKADATDTSGGTLPASLSIVADTKQKKRRRNPRKSKKLPETPEPKQPSETPEPKLAIDLNQKLEQLTKAQMDSARDTINGEFSKLTSYLEQLKNDEPPTGLSEETKKNILLSIRKLAVYFCHQFKFLKLHTHSILKLKMALNPRFKKKWSAVLRECLSADEKFKVLFTTLYMDHSSITVLFMSISKLIGHELSPPPPFEELFIDEIKLLSKEIKEEELANNDTIKIFEYLDLILSGKSAPQPAEYRRYFVSYWKDYKEWLKKEIIAHANDFENVSIPEEYLKSPESGYTEDLYTNFLKYFIGIDPIYVSYFELEKIRHEDKNKAVLEYCNMAPSNDPNFKMLAEGVRPFPELFFEILRELHDDEGENKC